jgi:hypothetical protein
MSFGSLTAKEVHYKTTYMMVSLFCIVILFDVVFFQSFMSFE